jgi:hydroxymethylbilane synthase
VAADLEGSHAGLEVELVVVETSGDRNLDSPLSELGGQGIFVKEVQRAVLELEADLAVHSAKDLPSATPAGLALVAVPLRADAADALVGRSLAGLGPGATVATGSPRRRSLLRSLRPDLNLVELRGNMATRLAAAGREGVDAVVAAVAALDRLGQGALVAERLEPEVFTPQVGQGALGIEARSDDARVLELLAAVDDAGSHRCLDAERAFLVGIGAGCTVPAGAWCTEEGGALRLRAVFERPDGTLARSEQLGVDPGVLGRAAATELAHAAGRT